MPVEVTIAEPGPGEALCPHCKGKGVYNKYDMGWHSLMHDPELAALRTCTCGGTGVYLISDGPPFPPLAF